MDTLFWISLLFKIFICGLVLWMLYSLLYKMRKKKDSIGDKTLVLISSIFFLLAGLFFLILLIFLALVNIHAIFSWVPLLFFLAMILFLVTGILFLIRYFKIKKKKVVKKRVSSFRRKSRCIALHSTKSVH